MLFFFFFNALGKTCFFAEKCSWSWSEAFHKCTLTLANCFGRGGGGRNPKKEGIGN